jgi:phosphoribulokinase
MLAEAGDFIASERASEPLHVVFHEHLHCSAVDRTRALNRHVDTTGNRHVRAKESRINRRINESASR